MLHFGAVDYRADVWVNGSLVAQHEGGQMPFSTDISRVLRKGDAAQRIVVRAEDDPRDPAQQAFVRGLYHLTKALDPTRPVLGNDGWELVASAIWGTTTMRRKVRPCVSAMARQQRSSAHC